MTNSKHSEIPWIDNGEGFIVNREGDICDVAPNGLNKTQKANAAFICEAVNKHDKLKEINAELLRVLKEFEAFTKKLLKNEVNIPCGFIEIALNARVAIAKAKAESK